jgi:hypothetical protein
VGRDLLSVIPAPNPVEELRKKVSGKFQITSEYSFEIFRGVATVFGIEALSIMSATMVVFIVILCQIKLYSFANSSKDLDQLDSFKFYRKRALSSKEVDLVLASVAFLHSLPSVSKAFLDRTGEQFLILGAKSIIDSMGGKCHPLVKKAHSPSNLSAWQKGVTSRLKGLVSTCPASSIHTFGFSEEWVKEATLQNVIDRCGFEKPPKVEDVKKMIFELLQITADGQEIQFNDPALTCGQKVPLEKELFDENTSVVISRVGRSETEASGSPMMDPKPTAASMSNADLRAALTNDEYALYQNAMYLGNNARLIELNQAARERLEANKSLNSIDFPNSMGSAPPQGIASQPVQQVLMPQARTQEVPIQQAASRPVVPVPSVQQTPLRSTQLGRGPTLPQTPQRMAQQQPSLPASPPPNRPKSGPN